MSSWDYSSFKRQPRGNNRVGDFGRLPSKIGGPTERRRHEDSMNRRAPRGHSSSNMGRHERRSYGDGSDGGGAFNAVVNDLPLPQPAVFNEQKADILQTPPEDAPDNKNGSLVAPVASTSKSAPSNIPLVDLEPSEDDNIKEELFPPNKKAILQESLDASANLKLIGLEYIVEVQHNTTKSQPPVYFCLLCGEKTKTVDTTLESQALIKRHLQSISHSRKYIEAYFPTLKKCMLSKIDGGPKSSAYRDGIYRICQKIMSTFGRMTVKIVVGLQLFGRRQEEIKKMIDNSTHYRENKEFLDLFLGGYHALENSYEKAFSDFEAELRKKNSRDRHRSSNDHPRDYHGSRRDSRDRYSRSRRSRSRSPRYERKSASQNSYTKDSPLGFDRSGKLQHRNDDSSQKSAFVDILANRRDRRERGGYSGLSSPEIGIRAPSRLLSKSVEREIERYIEKEKVLNEKLHEERKEYLNYPHSHRKYNDEWEKFYVEMTTVREISDPQIINREWIEHWKAFFFKAFELESRKRREQLMVDHHITSAELDQYYDYKSKSQVERRISRGNSSISSCSSQDALVTGKERPDDNKEEVTVISTFRLLSALENILDDLGPTVIRLLAKANSMEVNDGFGSSSNMIHEDEVFSLLWKAKEKLDYKISKDTIAGSQIPASKLCISNIKILIKKSKCELPQEPSNLTLSNEISIRAGIAKTVVEQFDAQGKIITESQLASIVEMEYARVKDSVASCSAAIQGQRTTTINHIMKQPEKEEIPSPKSEGDLEKMTCHQLADIFKRFREFNKITRCMILDYMKKIEKTNPNRVTEMKKIIHGKT